MDENTTVKSVHSYGGRVFQIVVSLLLLAGFAAFLFVPKAYGNDSLWAMILDVFKGGYADTTWLRYSLYGIVGAYAVLLICTVISLFVSAGSALACNFIKSFAAIAAMSAFVFALHKDGGADFTDLLLSDTTFVAVNAMTCTLALALLGIVVLNFVAYKARGIYKFFFLVIACGFLAFCKFPFIDGNTYVNLFEGITAGEGLVPMLTAYAFTALTWAVIVNIALAFLTVMIPYTSTLDLIRSVCMFLICAFALVMLGLYDSFANLLDNLGTVGVAALSLVELIYAIVVLALVRSKKKRAEAAEDSETDSPFVVGANDQMAIRGLEAPAAAQATETAAPSAAAAEPSAAQADQTATPDAAAANSAFEDAAQISIEDISAEAEKEESADADAEQEPENVRTEKDFDFEQARFDGKFNRAYAEFAEQEELKRQREEQERQQRAQQQAQQQAQQPFYGYGNYNYQQYQQTPPPYSANYAQQQAQQPYQPMQGYYNAGFVPDMFISSLTPAERDEFDRLFISRIYGENKRLPSYQIGGDNREFFSKIFVFMGRYRNVISEGLLEKIYNYSNSIK